MATRILSINGNSSMNYVIKTSLSEKYQVTTASCVSEGIYYMKTKDFHLIMIDLDSHTTENIDFINYIRNSWLYKKPFIALSHDQKLIDDISKEILTNSVLKPFNPLDLIKITDQLLDKRITLSV